MKTKNNKAVVVLMTAALLLTSLLPSGCVSRKNRDMTEIQLKAEEFIYQFATGDADTVKELVDGRFDYQISLAKQHEIMLKIASKTEIDDIETIEVDRKAGKAKIRTKLSYIDISEFGRDKNNRNISVEECIANVDTYESRQTSNFTFNFVLGDDGTWKIKDTTAERYEDLFNHQYFLSVMSISKDKAKEICLDIFNRLARGELRQDLFTYDINEMGAMNTWSRDAENIKDAMTEFAKAYFTFYTEHGLTIVETANAYEYKITGYMPSKEGLMSYYASEEYAIESNMATIRAELTNDNDKRQAVWDYYVAQIYYDMAKQIPNLMGEEFSVVFKFKTGALHANGINIQIQADGPLFKIDTNDIFACPKYEYAQGQAARKKAIQALFDAGELTRAQYDKYMSEFRDGGRDNAPQQTTVVDNNNGNINWQGTDGYPNQAVNVKEETPDWSNGNLIYGTSDPDKNGISMLYSKEPGWLNTAGYNISDNGITVMVKYDKKFAKGTELEFDWDINGSTQQYGVPFVVPEDGSDEFFFTIPAKLLSSGNTAEFRLWEKGHTHVIAYVKLTKT